MEQIIWKEKSGVSFLPKIIFLVILCANLTYASELVKDSTIVSVLKRQSKDERYIKQYLEQYFLDVYGFTDQKSLREFVSRF